MKHVCIQEFSSHRSILTFNKCILHRFLWLNISKAISRSLHHVFKHHFTQFGFPIIKVAASLNVVFLEFFLSLGIDPNQKRHEAIFSAVSSQASFDQKHKILQVLINTCKVDINQVSPKTGCSVIEWSIIQNGTDAIETIKYLIDRGADHNPDLLMSLAHDYEYYDLKEKIYSQLHCSEKLYKELVQKEKEKKQNKKNDGKPKIHLFFPQKEY